MKTYLSAALALVCAVLIIILFVIKSGDNAQHDADAGVIADFSNRLDNAQADLNIAAGNLLILSNRLDAGQSALLAVSNQLSAAESNNISSGQQMASLNQQVADLKAAGETFGQSVMALTNQLNGQLAALSNRIATTEASLQSANQQLSLLENRLRRDVAERLVMQRKFYNREELQAQLERLKDDPFTEEISEQSIYAGLDVEVNSNSFHVISPD
jgi:chromosome segregation ATPase